MIVAAVICAEECMPEGFRSSLNLKIRRQHHYIKQILYYTERTLYKNFKAIETFSEIKNEKIIYRLRCIVFAIESNGAEI